jgi:hypothetical protein
MASMQMSKQTGANGFSINNLRAPDALSAPCNQDSKDKKRHKSSLTSSTLHSLPV